jgi:general L-amino acid transport system permease protein
MTASRAAPPQAPLVLAQPAVRGLVYQVLALADAGRRSGSWRTTRWPTCVCAASRAASTSSPARRLFDIGELLIPYESSDPTGRPSCGPVNTLRVALIGIVGCHGAGHAGRRRPASRNAWCAACATAMSSVPQRAGAAAAAGLVPGADRDPAAPGEACARWPGLFFSKNGLQFPVPVWGLARGTVAGAFGAGRRRAGLAVGRRAAVRATGRPRRCCCRAWACWWLGAGRLGRGGMRRGWNMPRSRRSTSSTAAAFTPEFLSVLFGLIIYTAGVHRRGGARRHRSRCPRPDEAAGALGLSRGHEMRLVQLPQALRVIIPPLTNQYLNLTKNSSLAVAIGYPDLVSISNTALNQTGRAIECIAMHHAGVPDLSLITSVLMNLVQQAPHAAEGALTWPTASRPSPAAPPPHRSHRGLLPLGAAQPVQRAAEQFC